MKIKYEFANEIIEIEVSEEWGSVILEMDRLEYNNDKRETRRHLSLDTCCDIGSWLTVEPDPAVNLLREEESMQFEKKLSRLTKAQAEIIRCVLVEGMTLTEFAQSKGITKSAASHRFRTAKDKLKKLL